MRARKNRHHLYWPARDYTSRVDKTFRNLPCNIVVMDEMAHHLFHVCSDPPWKPTRGEMLAAINRHHERRCGCYE